MFHSSICSHDINACASDKANADTIALTLDIWLQLLYDSPDLTGISPKHLEKGIQWWRNYFVTTPYKNLVKSLDTLSHAILKEPKRVNEVPSMGSFLPWISKLPIIGVVYTKMYQESISSDGILTDPTQRIRFLISFLKFGKKAVVLDDSLVDNALREVRADEKDLKVLRTSERLLEHLAMVNQALFPKFVDESLHLTHGKGYTCEGVNGVIDKLDAVPSYSKRMLKKYFDRSTTWMASRNAYGYGWSNWLVAGTAYMNWLNYSKTYILTGEDGFITKGMTVAKDANNVRFIGHEPRDKMVLQQAVLRMFVITFDRTPVSRGINLADQTRSQEAAFYGSKDGWTSTIDLSRASNRLKWGNVKKVLARPILTHVEAVRTQYLNIEDEILKLQMASTMGSAVTFPLQTMMFYSLTVLAMLYHYHGVIAKSPRIPRYKVPQTDFAPQMVWNDIGFENHLPIYSPESLEKWFKRHVNKPGDFQSKRKDRYDNPEVYGDDINCPSKAVPILFALLEEFGLVVNTSKSFFGDDLVRESCGLYAINGVEMTPVTLKTPSFTGRPSIEILQSLIGLANRLGEAGCFQKTRQYVVRMCLNMEFSKEVPTYGGKNSIQFTHDPLDTSRIFTETPDLNWHLLSRKFTIDKIKRNLPPGAQQPSYVAEQRNEVRGFVVQPVFADDLKYSDKAGGRKGGKLLKKYQRLDVLVEFYRYNQAGRAFRREYTEDTYNEWSRIPGVTRSWLHSINGMRSSHGLNTYEKPISYRISVGWTPHCAQ